MRRLNDDRGAAAVIIAVSMVALIGFVGLVVDVGRIRQERRELARAADAAVLAVAADCGTGAQDCDDDTGTATAEEYADANSDDGASSVVEFDLDTDEQTVHVRTATIDGGDGSGDLDLMFMPALGYDTATIYAEATAEWGYPTGAGVLPLIFSDCEWFKFAPGGFPDPDALVVIYFHDGNSTEDCNAQAGQDTDGDDRLPGGFGWLDTNGGCAAVVNSGNWVDEDPGASPSTGCNAAEMRTLLLGKTVYITYFNDVQGLGANGQYHIAGIGAFFVTGYNFGGQFREPSAALAPCSGDLRCISGYLSTVVLDDDGDISGQNRGVVVVRLVS